MLKTAPQQKPNYQVDLSAMMAVCETNYWRLHKLLPKPFAALEEQDYFDFSIPSLICNQQERILRISIAETCPYTTTLEFYELGDDTIDESQRDVFNLSPRLSIRIYHDAKMAEVISFLRKRQYDGHYSYPNKDMHQQDEKAQLNLLLAEWLNHCLHYGHLADENILAAVIP